MLRSVCMLVAVDLWTNYSGVRSPSGELAPSRLPSSAIRSLREDGECFPAGRPGH